MNDYSSLDRRKAVRNPVSRAARIAGHNGPITKA